MATGFYAVRGPSIGGKLDPKLRIEGGGALPPRGKVERVGYRGQAHSYRKL